MSKTILIALLLTAAVTFLVIKAVFVLDKNSDDPSAQLMQMTQENTQDKSEEKQDEPDPSSQTQTTPQTVAEQQPQTQSAEEEKETVYKMLDFDRRLILIIGEQGKENCSIFCLAYAKAILDGSFNVNPYDYWDDGAVWSAAGFHDIAGKDPLDEVLKKAYDQIDSGRPAIIYTSGTYATTVTDKPQDRSASEHFVLLIGFRKNADRNDLKASDFYGIDPANAYKSTERNYIPWVTLTDTAPAKMLEEYALFVAVDQSAHVKTCIAHADSVRWDTSLSFPINPDYVQES